MELKTTKAQLAVYFSAWLQWWIKKNHYTQLQAAVRLDVTPGFINMIINNKRAASATQMEKIALAVNLDLLDILLRGQQILGVGKATALAAQPSPEHMLYTGLSREQLEDVGIYRDLLVAGGEGVEVITQSIRSLAEKKNIGSKDGTTYSIVLHDSIES